MSASTKPLAVVTGASTGIGFELAREFAQHGYDLVVAADDAAIADAGDRLRRLGADVLDVRVDLADYSGVEDLVARTAATGRPVDALAVNAGIGASGDFARGPELDEHLRVVNLNVTSAVHLTKRMLPDMVRRGQGRVLFTSSIAATSPGPYMSVYSASKAFLASFSQALRDELKDTGVTVTALMPGPTDTEFFRRADMTDTKLATGPKDDPADVAREGFEAMMAGKDHVVAGSVRNKVQATVSRVLPEPVKAAAHHRMSEPGSADD